MAVKNTFARRRTELPTGTPSGLSPGFADDRQKNVQWRAFLSKISLVGDRPRLSEVCKDLSEFLGPPTEAARHDKKFSASWGKGGPWAI
jgi:hypothetical protein